MITVEKILEKVDYLPPFPHTVTRVLQMLREPGVKTDEIADVIKFDQSVTSNVLKLCNSSYFGLSRTITNLREAVVYIGLNKLKKILILSGTQKYFDNENPGYETQKGELWTHVLAVSIVAGKLVEKINVKDKDELFVAALLHDIGKLVLNEFVMESYGEIMKMVEQKGMTFLEAEKNVLGMNHAEIGARILEIWKFSGEIISAVKKHHSPFEKDDSKLDNIVRISDTLAMIMGYGTGIDGLAYHGYSDICRLYGINREIMENIMADSLEEITKIKTEYEITAEL
ncbi:MAG TPA: HDOD domain-containing protein [bacterium]|nr:HDOD domain-containing protein [bacterium]